MSGSSRLLSPNEVEVRTLDISDVGEVTSIHFGAFPKSALTRLGVEAVRRYYAWQFQGPHELYPIGVTMRGELAGYCLGGVFPTAISGFLKRNKRFLAWRVVSHPWLLVNPLVRNRMWGGFETLWQTRNVPMPERPTVPKTEAKRPFDILAIAVHPRFQRLGLGRLLMDHAEALAIKNGFLVMTLVVNKDNAQALRFYETLAWEKAMMRGSWRGNMVKRLAPRPIAEPRRND